MILAALFLYELLNTMTAQPNTWDEFLGFLKQNSVAGGLFLLLWRGMSMVSNHFSKKQEEKLEEIAERVMIEYIAEKVNPKLIELNSKMDVIIEEQRQIRDLLYNRSHGQH